ncbi:MAG: DUF4287 domain-containing protein [Amphiplicatus sp.]
MTKSPEDAAASMIANMKAKTGKSLSEWTAIAKRSGKEKHGEIVSHLKGEHGLTHGYANMVAHTLLKSDAGSMSETTDLVAAQYAGDKTALKPIYDEIVKAVKSFGEVDISPKKAYVSLRRSKQFALVQPSTKIRLDLGINLKGEPPSGRLETSGSFNAMVSHRVKLEKPGDFDKQVKAWLKAAYDKA